MENTLKTEKQRLRKLYRQIRTDIEPGDREFWNAAIEKTVLEQPQVAGAEAVFVYLSRGGEVSTHGIVRALLGQGKRVLVPSPDIKALPHDGLFRVFDREETQGAHEPVRCHESRVSDVDVVLVPGIAWDREGYRVGFGGGYFDRLLAMVRQDCLAIGLAYECQVVDNVPRGEWDRKVGLLITEKAVYPAAT